MNEQLFYTLLIAFVVLAVLLAFRVLDKRRERAWREYMDRDHQERKDFRRHILASFTDTAKSIKFD